MAKVLRTHIALTAKVTPKKIAKRGPPARNCTPQSARILIIVIAVLVTAPRSITAQAEPTSNAKATRSPSETPMLLISFVRQLVTAQAFMVPPPLHTPHLHIPLPALLTDMDLLLLTETEDADHWPLVPAELT